MEKEFRPPPYADAQMEQPNVNYPGQPAAYPPPQTGPQAMPYQPPPYGTAAPYPNQPMMIPAAPQMTVTSLTDVPGRIICPHCSTEVLTETEHVSGLLTWMICGGLALFICWLCCCIPFCIDACKDVKHTCPNCRNIIRIYKRIQ